MKWRVVGYRIDGSRTVLPVKFKDREQARKVAEVSQALMPPNMHVVVEEDTNEEDDAV